MSNFYLKNDLKIIVQRKFFPSLNCFRLQRNSLDCFRISDASRVSAASASPHSAFRDEDLASFCNLYKYKFQAGQIYFAIGTITFWNWNKYILKFEQIPFAILTDASQSRSERWSLGKFFPSLHLNWSWLTNLYFETLTKARPGNPQWKTILFIYQNFNWTQSLYCAAAHHSRFLFQLRNEKVNWCDEVWPQIEIQIQMETGHKYKYKIQIQVHIKIWFRVAKLASIKKRRESKSDYSMYIITKFSFQI